MKNLSLVITLLLISFAGYTQNVQLQEPEFEGQIIFVNDTVGTGISLETTKFSVKKKAGASVYLTGIGKVKTSISVRSATSDTRLPQGEVLQFICKLNNNTLAPSKVIELIRFEAKQDSRVADIAESGTYSGTSAGDVGFIQFSATKYGESSYLVSVKNLSPGEYGFSLGKESTTIIHMFTVE